MQIGGAGGGAGVVVSWVVTREQGETRVGTY